MRGWKNQIFNLSKETNTNIICNYIIPFVGKVDMYVI